MRVQEKVKETSGQRKHNFNHNYNLMDFDTIEVNLVLTYFDNVKMAKIAKMARLSKMSKILKMSKMLKIPKMSKMLRC